MGLFSRRPRTTLPASVIDALPAYGHVALRARIAGQPVTDPRFDWDRFVGPVMLALSGDERDQAIEEIYQAALSADEPDEAVFGAFRLLSEFDFMIGDERFRELCDDSLEHLRALGLSSGHLNRYEADRWIETHGDLRSSFDGIHEVEVPSAATAPPVAELQPGASRLLALTAPLPDGNAFYAERGADGVYVVFSERPHSDEDPTRSRYDESMIGTFTSLADLLRALGRYFGTPPHWADDDLAPYFPSRRAR